MKMIKNINLMTKKKKIPKEYVNALGYIFLMNSPL